MATILKEGYAKIMRLFYTALDTGIHLREIARKAKLNENSATRFLQQMEKQAIISSKKEGNLKKYQIQKNKKTFLIFSLFSIEKYEHLPELTKKAIHTFLENLEKKPIITILFGSTAKENYTASSDIDLLLIVNTKINTEKAENYSEAQTSKKINTVQIRYPAFIQEIKTKNDKLIQSAINTGYPLTNPILYYEEILK
ncbi:hypothetical protein GF358_01425 [Candidatus Woesearchaeota archaeon]|nr:hypothetical protein [Candidatus Woesearchaeota archaeon]